MNDFEESKPVRQCMTEDKHPIFKHHVIPLQHGRGTCHTSGSLWSHAFFWYITAAHYDDIYHRIVILLAVFFAMQPIERPIRTHRA